MHHIVVKVVGQSLGSERCQCELDYWKKTQDRFLSYLEIHHVCLSSPNNV